MTTSNVHRRRLAPTVAERVELLSLAQSDDRAAVVDVLHELADARGVMCWRYPSDDSARVVGRMAAAGLVTVDTHEDGEGLDVRLLPEGLAILDRLGAVQ